MRKKKAAPQGADLFSQAELVPQAPSAPAAKVPAAKSPGAKPPGAKSPGAKPAAAKSRASAKQPASAKPPAPAAAPPLTVHDDLERRVRASGVRVEERLKLIRLLARSGGSDELQDTIRDLSERMRETARALQGELR